MKMYADTRARAKKSTIKVGDIVLARQRKHNKLSKQVPKQTRTLQNSTLCVKYKILFRSGKWQKCICINCNLNVNNQDMSLLCKQKVLCCIIMFSHLEVKKSALLASVKTIQLEDICFDKQGFGKKD